MAVYMQNSHKEFSIGGAQQAYLRFQGQFETLSLPGPEIKRCLDDLIHLGCVGYDAHSQKYRIVEEISVPG